jgi:sulfite oxidase
MENQKKLPIIRMDEVEKHKTAEKRIWVTYKGGVYDVTDFQKSHPGGKVAIN